MNRFTFLLLCFFISMSAQAAYKCEIALSHSQDDLVIANETIHATDKDMKSAMLEEFYIGHDMSSYNLKIFISGWKGEEEISATVLKESEVVSEKLSVRGEDKNSLWFDIYKLKINCSLV